MVGLLGTELRIKGGTPTTKSPRQCRFEGDGKSNGRRDVTVFSSLLTSKARDSISNHTLRLFTRFSHHTMITKGLLLNFYRFTALRKNVKTIKLMTLHVSMEPLLLYLSHKSSPYSIV